MIRVFRIASLKRAFKSNEKDKVKSMQNAPETGNDVRISISPDDEINLIMRALEKKHNVKLKKRVSVSGYIDDIDYRLVLTTDRKDFDDPSIYISGGSTNDVLKVNEAFIDDFWRDRANHEKIKRGEAEYDSVFGKESLEKSDIAPSRNAFLLRAQIEGLLRQ